jgi:hypothetical protein
MLTAWPDSTLVYVRADYAPPANAYSDSVVAIQTHPRDVNGNPQSPSGGGELSSYLKPEEQYAQTQRILAGEPRTSHLDVHA